MDLSLDMTFKIAYFKFYIKKTVIKITVLILDIVCIHEQENSASQF